ncbi:MAG: helicase-related protein, partial [Candidatus Tectomicrobia bacterium]
NIVSHWLEHAQDRKTIMFCSGVRHSAAIADRLKTNGIAAEHVEGRMHLKHRTGAIDRFRDGDTQVLTNSDLLLYGFDQPDTSCLVVARVITESGV